MLQTLRFLAAGLCFAWAIAPAPAQAFRGTSRHGEPKPPQETGFLNRAIEAHGVSYRFQVYLPEAFRREDRKPWPVILFPHGRGERDWEGMWQTQIGLPQAVRAHPERWPFVIVMPQCPLPGYWTDPEMLPMAMAALDQETAEFHLDPERTYLNGLSIGGDDNVVVPRQSEMMFEALKAAGGHVRQWVYQGLKHDCWTRAFDEPELPRWLLSHPKRAQAQPEWPAFAERLTIPLRPPAIKLTPAVLDVLAGEYRDASGHTVATLFRQGDQIWEKNLQGEMAELAAESPATFFYPNGSSLTRLTFERDAEGRVTAAVFHDDRHEESWEKRLQFPAVRKTSIAAGELRRRPGAGDPAKPRNPARHDCVVDSERILRGGSHVLQRMWSGFGAGAGVLPAMRSSGGDSGSPRARPSISSTELRGQGENAGHRLVHLCRLLSADRNRRAGLCQCLSLRALRPLDAWPLGGRRHATVLVRARAAAFYLGLPGAARRTFAGCRMGPAGAGAVGPDRGHRGGVLQPAQVPFRNGNGHLDPGDAAGLPELDALRPALKTATSHSLRSGSRPTSGIGWRPCKASVPHPWRVLVFLRQGWETTNPNLNPDHEEASAAESKACVLFFW